MEVGFVYRDVLFNILKPWYESKTLSQSKDITKDLRKRFKDIKRITSDH